jgi:exosortase
MEKVESIQEEEYRGWLFLAFVIVFVLAFFKPLRDLVLISFHSDTFSYIPFIPIISAYLFHVDRRHIFSQKKSYSAAGLIPISIGILVLLIVGKRTASPDHFGYLSIAAISMLLIWIGGFTLCYGIKSLRAAAFALLFLFFMVPIPANVLDKFILVLQTASAEAAYGFLKAMGVPVVRDGFVFHLPSLNIEVAKECSGIRSALSLVITGLVAGKLFLRTRWARTLLVIAIVPITILKNGFRIAALSVLGVYVDKRILGSELHRNGGVLFFILALLLVWWVIALLGKAERNLKSNREGAARELRIK